MVAALACVLALGGTAAAQDRGRTKAEGKVLDEEGKPLQDAIVAAVKEGFEKPFQQAKTNNKGEWRIDNLAAGAWKFYFGGKEGLEEKAIDVTVGESGTVKVPDVTLGKPVDHQAVVNAELKRAMELMQTKQGGEARKIYENILAKYPTLPQDFQGQLHGAIAQTYMAEGALPAAVDQLKKATAMDPGNVELQLALGEMLLQTDQTAEAEKVLLAVDMTQVKDPFPYINLVIRKINDQQSEEALALLDKLVAQFPNESSLLYYRGRANIAAKKMPEAKADLEKFVAAAKPDARELEDAKKILEQLKEVK